MILLFYYFFKHKGHFYKPINSFSYKKFCKSKTIPKKEQKIDISYYFTFALF